MMDVRRQRAHLMRIPKLLAVVVLGTVILQAQTATDDGVRRILLDPKIKIAEDALARGHDTLVTNIIALTEIPAPPFQEARRAAAYLKLLTDAGLTDVERDAAGNVMGLRKGTGSGPLLAVAAHLDTVFPEGTDVKVKRTGRGSRPPASATTRARWPSSSRSSARWTRPRSARRATSCSSATWVKKARAIFGA